MEPHVIRLGTSQSVYANGSQARITLGIGLRRQLRRVLRQGRYDIVHVHSPLSPILPVLAIEEAECPVVGTFHTYFDRSVAYTVGRRYFQNRLDLLGGDRFVAFDHHRAQPLLKPIGRSSPTELTPTSSTPTSLSPTCFAMTCRRFSSSAGSIRATDSRH